MPFGFVINSYVIFGPVRFRRVLLCPVRFRSVPFVHVGNVLFTSGMFSWVVLFSNAQVNTHKGRQDRRPTP